MDMDQKQAIGIKADSVYKQYGQRSVLKGITLEVSPGEIFVLMGPSGAGKSVFLKLLMGLEGVDAGDIFVDGRPVVVGVLPNVTMGVVFQSSALFNSMTVFDNLALYAREHRLMDEEGLKKKIFSILQLLKIESVAEFYPSALSGGMRKRVAIGRALMMDPQLMLYDEPTSELDPQTGAMIGEIMGNLRQSLGVTSVIVSHDVPVAMAIADRIGILMEGQLKVVGKPQEVAACEDPVVRRFLYPEINLQNTHFYQK